MQGMTWGEARAWSDASTEFEKLLGREPSVDYADRSSWTDLHWAANLNLPELAEWLLEKGMHTDQPVTAPFSDELVADFNRLVPYPKFWGWIDYLSEEGRSAKNWSENRRSMLGYTALHLATRFNAVRVAELLIAHRADVNARTENGGTPLHVAAFGNAAQIAELLIAHRADVNARSEFGTPLDAAKENGNSQLAELLIAKGAKDPAEETQDRR